VTTGTGQAGAPLAAAAAMADSLRTGQAMPRPVPAPGRADAIACSGTLPGAPKSCAAAADPRGAGLAISSR
jgi:gamma-glutamyltranspeptidase/glutathione hydrolase